jgi:hypothetical protein
LYQSKTLFSICYRIYPEGSWVAAEMLLKSSAEMLCRFESASECNILNWQVGKLKKFLGYGKSVMPNVFDWRHVQFGFE